MVLEFITVNKQNPLEKSFIFTTNPNYTCGFDKEYYYSSSVSKDTEVMPFQSINGFQWMLL